MLNCKNHIKYIQHYYNEIRKKTTTTIIIIMNKNDNMKLQKN